MQQHRHSIDTNLTRFACISTKRIDNSIVFLKQKSWKELKQAAVVARYRYLDVDFERKDAKWQKTDNAGYLGLRFVF